MSAESLELVNLAVLLPVSTCSRHQSFPSVMVVIRAYFGTLIITCFHRNESVVKGGRTTPFFRKDSVLYRPYKGVLCAWSPLVSAKSRVLQTVEYKAKPINRVFSKRRPIF